MSDYLWPTTLIPARSEIMLRDLSGRFSSPFTGTTRTYSRPGGELRQMTLSLPPLTAAKAAALRGLLAKLRGGVHRVWCRDHSYVKRGSFPATELIQNNVFSNGTTGWSATYGTITAADGILRLTVASHSATQYPQAFQNVTLVSGVAYAFRSFYQNVVGSQTFGPFFYYGASASTNYTTTLGMRTLAAVADGTAGLVLLVFDDDAATADSFESPYTSVARCALIAGASQASSVLNIDQLPISTAGLLLEGDQVQIGEELLTVAAPLNSDSGGAGKLFLHRPVRSSPADNAPVIIHEPMGLFLLAESENGWENIPGRFTNASVTLVEAVR